jgi:hypothetical protein
MHSHHHDHQSGQGKHKLDELLRPGLHKDWRTWVVVGLMLAAIGIYVFTLDDAVRPGSPQKDTPAAATPR